MSSRLRSPAQVYISYLVTHPQGYATADIKERLISDSLDFIGDAYIDRVRKELPRVPKPFYPTDITHRISYQYICEQRINRLFMPDVTMRLAYGLLRHPNSKLVAESMLLCGQQYQLIADVLMRQYGKRYTADAVALFNHYFWNYEMLDINDLRILSSLRVSTLAESVPEFKGKEDALRSMQYKDPRRIAAELPRGACSAFAVQLCLGIMPPTAQIAERIKETALLGVQRAAEIALLNPHRGDEQYSNWASGSRHMFEIEQLCAKPQDSLKGLETVGLRTDPTPVPTIGQITSGAHTVDMLPPNQDTEVLDGVDEADTEPSDTNSPG